MLDRLCQNMLVKLVDGREPLNIPANASSIPISYLFEVLHIALPSFH